MRVAGIEICLLLDLRSATKRINIFLISKVRAAKVNFCGGRQRILYNWGESGGKIENFVARAINNYGIKVLNVCGLIKIAYLCALFSHVG